MPHFKSINFYQNRPKLKLFLQKKDTKFWSSSPDLQNSPLSLQISSCAPEPNHIFALLISMQQEFSLMRGFFKSFNFYQNKLKTKLFIQKNKIFRVLEAPPPMASDGWGEAPRPPKQLLHPLQISGYVPNTKRMLLTLPSFRISL